MPERKQRRKAIVPNTASVDALDEQQISTSRISSFAVSPRVGQDIRAISPDHVLSMAESISVLGLLEPIVVDSKFRLLAGYHRLYAARLLTLHPISREAFWLATFNSRPTCAELNRMIILPVLEDSFPVHVLPLDASTETALAVAVEIAENERRRNFSREDIRGLAERLKSSGFRTERGRARAGERAVIPTLSTILGKSRATVFRMLRDETSGDTSRCNTSAKCASNELLADRALLRALVKWDASQGNKVFREPVMSLMALLRNHLSSFSSDGIEV